jgi:hypothetical protein
LRLDGRRGLVEFTSTDDVQLTRPITPPNGFAMRQIAAPPLADQARAGVSQPLRGVYDNLARE